MPPPGTDAGIRRLGGWWTLAAAGFTSIVPAQGGPTVVLEAASGGSSPDWCLVQPEIAKFTRVCSYDRAGLGWSDSSPRPRSMPQIAEDLSNLLAGAGIEGPYVLVGHSLGGLYVQYLARLISRSRQALVRHIWRNERTLDQVTEKGCAEDTAGGSNLS